MADRKSISEFSLIEKYFTLKQSINRSDVLISIGDDAAVVKTPPDQLLVITTDTLVTGKHFPIATTAFDIGYKALAVNLSDLAAMGAEPSWITLALSMPDINAAWLEEFSNGLFKLANQFGVQLVGGDTTQGPLTVTIQAHGFVPPTQIIKRNGALPGDKIYVSGTLGNAGLGLQIALGNLQLPNDEEKKILTYLNRPNPRVSLGIALRDIATSAIDISDGLLADLNHILKSSGVGASIDVTQIPLSAILLNHLSLSAAQKLAMTAGDDYELCFTVPPEHESKLIAMLKEQQITCYCIGTIENTNELNLLGYDGEINNFGFEHFR